ncbi:hypothetical protein EVAR_62998_1 [Eumeta japonica]|uniref:Uncharacterized protein n=1 Tax=Eumeta variegata TaxID=151549 RepID=A0A4C2AF88_EUMVA|nr:hypothetical protein EVAR_62998_1 [Eumeta japonica]
MPVEYAHEGDTEPFACESDSHFFNISPLIVFANVRYFIAPSLEVELSVSDSGSYDSLSADFIFTLLRHGSETNSVHNKELEFVNGTMFLGITLDNTLLWGPRISKLAKRILALPPMKLIKLEIYQTARLRCGGPSGAWTEVTLSGRTLAQRGYGGRARCCRASLELTANFEQRAGHYARNAPPVGRVSRARRAACRRLRTYFPECRNLFLLSHKTAGVDDVENYLSVRTGPAMCTVFEFKSFPGDKFQKVSELGWLAPRRVGSAWAALVFVAVGWVAFPCTVAPLRAERAARLTDRRNPVY